MIHPRRSLKPGRDDQKFCYQAIAGIGVDGRKSMLKASKIQRAVFHIDFVEYLLVLIHSKNTFLMYILTDKVSMQGNTQFAFQVCKFEKTTKEM